jgi:hypothetical protein
MRETAAPVTETPAEWIKRHPKASPQMRLFMGFLQSLGATLETVEAKPRSMAEAPLAPRISSRKNSRSKKTAI